MTPAKPTSRATLARYAALLGSFSLARKCLAAFDAERAAGRHATIHMHNNGFRLTRADGTSTRY